MGAADEGRWEPRASAESLPSGTHAVCPRCGTAASQDRWCTRCGLNLEQQPDLPTADAYAASIREQQWLAGHPPSPSAASRAADWAIATPSAFTFTPTVSRNRLLFAGALVLAGVNLLDVIAAVLSLLVAGDEHFPAGISIARGFSVTAAFIWVAAFTVAATAMSGPSAVRQVRLSRVALLAVGAATCGC